MGRPTSAASRVRKTSRTVEYRGRKFQKAKGGDKWNHFDVETGEHYWISGPRRDGQDRLYPQSSRPVEIDEDVHKEYWTTIRGRPEPWASDVTARIRAVTSPRWRRAGCRTALHAACRPSPA